jgi:hypothetical protein
MPAQLLGDHAAEQRADHRRYAPRGAEHALPLAALGGREQVGDDRQRAREQTGRADTLHRAERDQLTRTLREPAGERAREKDADRDQQDAAPAVEVGELAVDRHQHCRCNEVRGRDPYVDARLDREIDLDEWTRSRHDRLIERREQEPEQRANHDGDLLAGAE